MNITISTALITCNLSRQPTFQQCSKLPSAATVVGGQTFDCDWTCDNVASACKHLINVYVPITNFYNSLNILTIKNCLVSFGLASNFFLLLTLFSPALTGATFVYLRCIAVVNLIQGVCAELNSDQHIYDFILNLSNGDDCAPFRFQMIFNASAGVLNVCSYLISLVSTIDRFVAVCMPTKYTRLTIKTLLIISLISTILTCSPIFLKNYVQYQTCASYSPKSGISYDDILLAIKFLIVAVLLAFSVLILLALKKRRRRIADTMASQTSKQEFEKIRLLCRFQLVDTVVIVVNIIFSISGQTNVSVINRIRNGGVVQCNIASYERFISGLMSDEAHDLNYFINVLSAPKAHGELFIFYAIFFPKFRAAFVEIMRKCFRKCKQLRCRSVL